MTKEARALVGAATDIASLKKAISKVMSAKTREAYAAVFDIGIDPPKVPLPRGIKVSAFAMSALERLHKRNADVQDLIIERCQDAPIDVAVWERPLLWLYNIALAAPERLLADKRAVAGLQRSLEWKDTGSGSVAANAASALGAMPHPPSLPLIIARLERVSGAAEFDLVLCWSVAQVLLKLGGTVDELERLKAVRKRVRKKDAQVDKLIARLEKRLE